MNAALPGSKSLAEVFAEIQSIESVSPGEVYAKEILEAQDTTGAQLSDVLGWAFALDSITQSFSPGTIRHTAVVMKVTEYLLNELGIEADIHDLTVGTIQLPAEAAAAVAEIKAIAGLIVMASSLKTTGYDLKGVGSDLARSQAEALLRPGYQPSEEIQRIIKENMVIGPGGMRMLDDLFCAARNWFLEQNKEVYVCSPDNSFNTALKLQDAHQIRKADFEGVKLGTQVEIETDAQEGLHITADKVNSFYQETHENTNKGVIWYLTPVGNPSGTKIDPEQLSAALNAINSNDSNAVIILDMVYVRTLEDKEANELLEKIWNSPALPQITFLESFSKTHGLCNSRLGLVFNAEQSDSDHSKFFTRYKKHNMEVGAGNGEWKDALLTALGTLPQERQDLFKDLHLFWAQERTGLYNFLMKNGEFEHIFDDQDHINEEAISRPGSLYLFLKLKEGVSAQEAIIATGCFGVPTPMGNDLYMRFSVGQSTKPRFAVNPPERLFPKEGLATDLRRGWSLIRNSASPSLWYSLIEQARNA